MPAGSLLSVWEYIASEVWWKLDSDIPEIEPMEFGEDGFRIILSNLISALKPDHKDYQRIWETLNQKGDYRGILGNISVASIKSEEALLRTINDIYLVFKKEIQPRELGFLVISKYVFLLDRFFKNFSLRYSLRKPFGIIINIDSIFADVYRELDRIAK